MKHSVRLLLLRLLGRLLRLATTARRQPVRRILVIKPDHLGDVLLLTPALRALRQHMPHAHIALMIGPWSRQVVAHNPDPDALICFPFPGFTRQPKARMRDPYLLLFKTALLLRAGRFDAAVIARDDHWWGALLAALAGIPSRIGYDVATVRPFLTTALPHNPAQHVTMQGLELIAGLIGHPIEERPATRPPLDDNDREWATQRLSECELDGTPIVAIHPGTGGESKLWIGHRWTEVANALAKRGYRVLLTGGPGEQALVDQIAGRTTQPPVTLVGAATVGQLAAIYERCELVVGVDSGPLHLAASVGVPTVTLFGPSDPQRFGPGSHPRRHIVLRSGLWCSPCNDLTDCPRGTVPSECMTLVRTQQVVSAIEWLEA